MEESMKKVLMITIPLGLVVLLVGGHFAYSRGFRGHHGEWAKDFLFYKLDQVSKELNLDSAQQAQMDTLKQDLSTMMEQRRAKRQEVHKLVHDELKKDNPDIRKVQPLIDQQIDDMAQNAHQLVGRISDFYSQLKPEQKKALSRIVEERFEHHESQD
jgi:Spy/CpxP family protein refolding chaperone